MKKIAATVVDSSSGSQGRKGGEGGEGGAKPKSQGSKTVTFVDESSPASTGNGSTSAESSDKPHPVTVSHSEEPPIVTVDKPSSGGVVSNEVVGSEVTQNGVANLEKTGHDEHVVEPQESEKGGGGEREGGEGEEREGEIPARSLSPIERRLRACSPEREREGQVSVTTPFGDHLRMWLMPNHAPPMRGRDVWYMYMYMDNMCIAH